MAAAAFVEPEPVVPLTFARLDERRRSAVDRAERLEEDERVPGEDAEVDRDLHPGQQFHLVGRTAAKDDGHAPNQRIEIDVRSDDDERRRQKDVRLPLERAIAEGSTDRRMEAHQEHERREIDGEDPGAEGRVDKFARHAPPERLGQSRRREEQSDRTEDQRQDAGEDACARAAGSGADPPGTGAEYPRAIIGRRQNAAGNCSIPLGPRPIAAAAASSNTTSMPN